ILNYQAVRGGIKCRIFPTTLVEGAMAWYRSLPQGSITSWKDLCKQFTSHFTASRKHPKTEANLEAVRQGPNKTLRSYIERFNKEAVQGMAVTLGKPKTSSQPLSFYLEELPGGSANSQIPLLVRADMANFDVRRILVDSGSSCDIMYAHLFRTLQLDESHLTPYLGSDLQGFNGATTKPWGYVDLIVTFGHNETAK
ncbi:hypothetical protein TSUD_424770, partial [Trifolium subterraneum]